MFIGSLEVEIQAIVWRSWKMSWSSTVIVHSLCIQRDSSPMGKTGPSGFFDDFRKWSESWLLDRLWISNKVYLEASAFVSTNMKKKKQCWIYPEKKKFSKNTIFWMYNFVVTVCTPKMIQTWQGVWTTFDIHHPWHRQVKDETSVCMQLQ